MLLLVAGLVVVVFVILVVVFLSVRSMRADEGNDHPARSAGRDRAGRGGVRRRPAEDDWPADHEPGYSDTEHDQPRGILPRPRAHQHDEDPGRRAGPQKRPDARRRQRQESGSRVTGGARDRSDADWLTGDWGGVSDEQYWAELSADKPLATTARSAQADGGAHRDAATWGREADADPADAGDRSAYRDPAPARPQQEAAPTMAPAGASAAQFSLHSGPARPGWTPAEPADAPVPSEPPAFAGPAAVAEPAAPTEPWADPMSTGSVDTDPSIGVRNWQDSGWQGGGWQEAAGGAATWQAPRRDEPATRDSRAWTEDPLTSPSFSEPSSYPTDSRSYGGSPARDRGVNEPGGGSDSSSHGHGYDYRTVPAWEDSYGSRHEGGWRDPGHEYPGGLDPLPEPAASAAGTDGDWPSAPTSPGAPSFQQPHESWERRDAGYDDASRHDPYTDPGRPSWPDHYESTRYDPAGYDSDHRRDSASSGYYGDTGYDPAGYGPADSGYGQPGYGPGETGYQPSQYGSPGTGYDLPGYDRGYHRPRHGAPDADYELPAYGSGASHGGPGQGSGYGRYPDYDAGRR
jgi:hypothetical protein